eukprot:977786-Ditylum_brightwellii.AAC.1
MSGVPTFATFWGGFVMMLLSAFKNEWSCLSDSWILTMGRTGLGVGLRLVEKFWCWDMVWLGGGEKDKRRKKIKI